MRRTNPCWPVCLGPGRTAGCHATCPEWAKHDKIKFARYIEKEKELMLEDDITQHLMATMERMKRGKRK